MFPISLFVRYIVSSYTYNFVFGIQFGHISNCISYSLMRILTLVSSKT